MNFMKKISTLAIALLAVSAMAGSAADVKKIAAVYSKMDGYSVKKDMTGLKSLLNSIATKDCAFTDPKGKAQTVGQVLGQMAMQMGAIDKFITSTSHIDKTTEKGTTIVATVSSNYALLTKAGADGKAHKIEGSSVSIDTWVKVGSDWKLQGSKTTKETTKMDGKVFPG